MFRLDCFNVKCFNEEFGLSHPDGDVKNVRLVV